MNITNSEGASSEVDIDQLWNQAPPSPGNGSSHETGKRKSVAAVLVDMALDRYAMFCDMDRNPYAVPHTGGHIVFPLRGSALSLRAELGREYREATGGSVAGSQALTDAMTTLEGYAQDVAARQVGLRVAACDDAIWVDLGRADHQVVRIDASGWSVVSDGVPVLFRRSSLTGELPLPEEGDINELWRLLNVTAADRPLVFAWLVAAIGMPDLARPILTLTGEQGTGKSTASRMLACLVDPSGAPARKPPKDVEAWVSMAAASYVICLDNLSNIPEWLSDSLCRAVTGDGDVRRKLYTDGDQTVFAFRRALILNGIDLGGMRGDLSERMLAVGLDTIPANRRMREGDIARAWSEAYPRILGAVFTGVANYLKFAPHVEADTYSRMADFSHLLACLDQAYDTAGMQRYRDKASLMARESLMASPFMAALIDPGTITEPFTGSAASLLDLVESRHCNHQGSNWPQSGRGVSRLLKRHSPALRSIGWQVDHREDPATHSLSWTIDHVTRQKGGKYPGYPGNNQNRPLARANTAGIKQDVIPENSGNPGDLDLSTGIAGISRNNTLSLSRRKTPSQTTIEGDSGITGVDSHPLSGDTTAAALGIEDAWRRYPNEPGDYTCDACGESLLTDHQGRTPRCHDWHKKSQQNINHN